jgi:arylsulfatase A-like enzyme
MMRRAWIAGAVLALVAAGGVALLLRPSPGRPERTVVLVVLDTVRADSLPTGGAPAERAPWIAELAERSVVFTSAFSTSSWTAPSTASLFTGMYPTEHGVTEGFRAQQRAAGAKIELDEPDIELRSLPSAVPTLPERLQSAGWRTLGVANNLNIGPELGFDRGFERFASERNADTKALFDQVRDWTSAPDPRPLFLYLHLNEAHHPYVAQRPFYRRPEQRGQEKQARYASEISYMDHELGRLADDLGWDEDTVIVLVSDHGEAFGEHGDEGHIFSLYGEVNRVAMLLHAPGLPEGRRVSLPTSLVDVPATLTDVLGLPPPEGPGRSLVPLAQGREEGFADRVIFGHRASPRQGATLWTAIRGPWKLLDHHGLGPSYTLYDLASDPGETVDQSARAPEVLASLAAALEQFQASATVPGAAVTVPVDEQLYEHLEELGYVEQ